MRIGNNIVHHNFQYYMLLNHVLNKKIVYIIGIYITWPTYSGTFVDVYNFKMRGETETSNNKTQGETII